MSEALNFKISGSIRLYPGGSAAEAAPASAGPGRGVA
jgi:hypothetical protein